MREATRGLRRLAALVAAAALVTLAGAQAYYPAEPGYAWTYSNGETQTLSGPREVDGRTVLVLTHAMNGVPVSEEYLRYQDDGVVSFGTAAGGQVMRYQPPLRVYPASPLAPGDAWESTTTVEGVDITLSSTVEGVRGVQTPAGRFNALLVRQVTLTSSGGRTSLNLYFVPSVGVVRFETRDGTTVDLIETNF